MRFCSARKTPPVLEASVDGEKRIEHICAVNKFATASRVAATLPSPPQGSTVHCKMLNKVLTFNSIRSFISLGTQDQSYVGNLIAVGCDLNIMLILDLIVVLGIFYEVGH